jgi:hypothetical protein
MEFSVEKTGDLFTVTRTADVSPPEREEGLTLDLNVDQSLFDIKVGGRRAGALAVYCPATRGGCQTTANCPIMP